MAAFSYNVDVQGVILQTTVVKSASMVDTNVSELKTLCAATRNPIIGLDVEWKPHSSSTATDKRVAILQLCIGTRCLIIQLRYLNNNVVPDSLKNLIADGGVSFVGVGITEDLGKLRNDYGLNCSSGIELGQRAASVLGKSEYPKYGLADLAREVVGLNVQKPTNVTCSNWDNETLTNEQIKYATIDAYASYLIGKKLLG